MPLSAAPRVLIVIPALNEAAHIKDVLNFALGFAERADGLVVVADGGSTDGTREIARRAASIWSRAAWPASPGAGPISRAKSPHRARHERLPMIQVFGHKAPDTDSTWPMIRHGGGDPLPFAGADEGQRLTR